MEFAVKLEYNYYINVSYRNSSERYVQFPLDEINNLYMEASEEEWINP